MAIHLGLLLPTASSNLPGCAPETAHIHPYLVLLPVGFAVPLLLPEARCALTAPFHPYLLLGGIFSVALSLRLPWPGVTRHRVSVEPGLSSAYKQQPSGRLTWGLCRVIRLSSQVFRLLKGLRCGTYWGRKILPATLWNQKMKPLVFITGLILSAFLLAACGKDKAEPLGLEEADLGP